MADDVEVILKENQFIRRLEENLLCFENAGGIQESDNLAELRTLTRGKMLRSELEAKYPVGKSLSVRIVPKAKLFGKEQLPLVLTGKVIVRLERFVEKGSDDEAISLSDLNVILSKESDLANRSRYELVLGLFSPTGWMEDAKRFIANDQPGTGWASSYVYPVLIGPEVTELAWDKKNEKVKSCIQYFSGLTTQERSRVCKEKIEREILVQDFANLERIAKTEDFDIGFVKKIAESLSNERKNLTLTTVRDVGLVLKRRT